MRGVFAVISLGLVAACHPPARPGELPARSIGAPPVATVTSPVARTARVSGMVVDDAMRTPLLGATIVLASDAGPTETALSDENGAFELAVTPGTWRVTTYYVDARTVHPAIHAIADETIARDLRVPHADVLAAELTPAERAACPPSDVAASPRDRDDLIRAVLERYLRGTSTYAGRAPAGEPIYVASPAGAPIRTSALPAIGRRIVLRTPAQLEAEATRRGRRIDFVDVHVKIAGDCAEVSIGPEVAQPAGDHADICSCSDHDTWEKHDGRWHHREHAISTCG